MSLSRSKRALATIWISRNRQNYLGLFVALSLLFIVNPFILSGAGGNFVSHLGLHIVSLFIVLMALQSVWWDRRVLVPALLLAMPREVLHLVALTSGRTDLLPLVHGLSFVLFSLVLTRVLVDVMQHRAISRSTLLGATCVYLMMGLAWSDLFLVLEWLQPRSFQVTADPSRGDVIRDVQGPELLYFSYITLTGIGYGDIVPVRLPARMLASLEGLLAHLYIAILIGWLVAVHVSQRNTIPREHKPDGER